MKKPEKLSLACARLDRYLTERNLADIAGGTPAYLLLLRRFLRDPAVHASPRSLLPSRPLTQTDMGEAQRLNRLFYVGQMPDAGGYVSFSSDGPPTGRMLRHELVFMAVDYDRLEADRLAQVFADVLEEGGAMLEWATENRDGPGWSAGPTGLEALALSERKESMAAGMLNEREFRLCALEAAARLVGLRADPLFSAVQYLAAHARRESYEQELGMLWTAMAEEVVVYAASRDSRTFNYLYDVSPEEAQRVDEERWRQQREAGRAHPDDPYVVE